MFSRTVVASDLLGKVDRSLLSRLTVLMYDFRHFLVVDNGFKIDFRCSQVLAPKRK